MCLCADPVYPGRNFAKLFVHCLTLTELRAPLNVRCIRQHASERACATRNQQSDAIAVLLPTNLVFQPGFASALLGEDLEEIKSTIISVKFLKHCVLITSTNQHALGFSPQRSFETHWMFWLRSNLWLTESRNQDECPTFRRRSFGSTTTRDDIIGARTNKVFLIRGELIANKELSSSMYFPNNAFSFS